MGADDLAGGGGSDAADYSELNPSGGNLQLQSDGEGGLVVRAFGSTDFDRLTGFETVIGSPDRTEAIGVFDIGSDPGSVEVALDVDLAAERATFGPDGTDGPAVTVRVVDFDVVATSPFDDTIVGDDGDNRFFGSQGDDTIPRGRRRRHPVLLQ